MPGRWRRRSSRRSTTDRQGRYLFERLPAGLYKIIAHKPGFVPVVELLLRRSPDKPQTLDLHLAEERPGDLQAAESFWETRSRIPPDILRQIEHMGLPRRELPESTLGPGILVDGAAVREAPDGHPGVGRPKSATARPRWSNRASTSVAPLARPRSTWRASSPRSRRRTRGASLPEGEVKNLALQLSRPDSSRFSFVGSTNELGELRHDGILPVDLEHYRLSWSGPHRRWPVRLFGPAHRRGQPLQRRIEHRQSAGGVALLECPRGSYRRDLGETTSLTTGPLLPSARGLRPSGARYGCRASTRAIVGLYGKADSQIQPRILVEYGLFSSMSEGGCVSHAARRRSRRPGIRLDRPDPPSPSGRCAKTVMCSSSASPRPSTPTAPPAARWASRATR